VNAGNAAIHIARCTFVRNIGIYPPLGSGGGLSAFGAALIEDCQFIRNSSASGGAIHRFAVAGAAV